jgi:hypothetical protein
MARLAQDVETLDTRLEDEVPDGATEAEELRQVLERLQALSLESARSLMGTNNATPANPSTYADTNLKILSTSNKTGWWVG